MGVLTYQKVSTRFAFQKSWPGLGLNQFGCGQARPALSPLARGRSFAAVCQRVWLYLLPWITCFLSASGSLNVPFLLALGPHPSLNRATQKCKALWQGTHRGL